MRKTIITSLILLSSIQCISQSSRQQSWLFLNFDYKLSDKNIVALQFWNRAFYQKAYNHNLYFANIAYNHTHTVKTHFLGGVFNVMNVKEDIAEVASEETKDTYTLIPWQGVSHDLFHIGKGVVGTLTRFEEHMNFSNGYDLDIRFRERLQFRHPLSSNLSLNATTEVLIFLDEEGSEDFFNPHELRTFIGLNYHLGTKILLEADYAIYHTRNRDNSLQYSFSNHMYMLSIDYILTPKHKDHKHHKKRHY